MINSTISNNHGTLSLGMIDNSTLTIANSILWNNTLAYAGRCDMVGIWNGTPAIIDFKTSKKGKYIHKGCHIKNCNAKNIL